MVTITSKQFSLFIMLLILSVSIAVSVIGISFTQNVYAATFPRYGHAPDHSWVSGKLTFNPLEGGCWSLKFSENKDDDIFALNFDNQQQISQFKDGDLVVVKGKQEGKKFSMACPPSVYKASDITSNDPSFTPGAQRIEIRKDQEGQIKIVPPTNQLSQKITPEYASEKIVRHGYALIDAYIKELPAPRCTFPDGQFRFWFNGGTGKDVLISPACIPPGGIWRNISFVNTDDTAIMIVLDGPISGTPGTPNEEAIRGAISNLSARLSDSKMLVKIIYKNGTPDLNFDLSKETDLQKFIDLMFSTIKLSKRNYLVFPSNLSS